MLKSDKKVRLVLFAASLLFAEIASSQTTTFQATYGTSTEDIGNFIQQTADGGYIICGAKADPGTVGYYDFSVIKTDANGAVQWAQTFGDSAYNEQAQCIRQTSDGGYAIYGSRSGRSSSAAYLVKIGADGNLLWSSAQAGSDSIRYGYGLVVAPDGGYQTASFDGISEDTNYFQLQKTDAAGNIQWGPKNVVNGIGFSSSLALTKDGNYISVGTTSTTYDEVTENFYSMITLVKMNTSGGLIWSKTFQASQGHGTEDYLQGFGVQATNDGGYVVCGSTSVNTNGGIDIFLLKTNSSGDSLWSKNYGGAQNDFAISVKEAPGGGFVLTGNTASYGVGSTDIFILKTDANGDSLWMKTYGGTGTEEAGDIEVTTDSGFAVVGTSDSYSSAENQIFMVKTDKTGAISNGGVTGIKELNDTSRFTVFPNPATDVLYVDYDVKLTSANYFVIYNSEGKEVYREIVSAEKGLLEINIRQMASGLYISGIETEGVFAETKRMVISH